MRQRHDTGESSSTISMARGANGPMDAPCTKESTLRRFFLWSNVAACRDHEISTAPPLRLCHHVTTHIFIFLHNRTKTSSGCRLTAFPTSSKNKASIPASASLIYAEMSSRDSESRAHTDAALPPRHKHFHISSQQHEDKQRIFDLWRCRRRPGAKPRFQRRHPSSMSI